MLGNTNRLGQKIIDSFIHSKCCIDKALCPRTNAAYNVKIEFVKKGEFLREVDTVKIPQDHGLSVQHSLAVFLCSTPTRQNSHHQW